MSYKRPILQEIFLEIKIKENLISEENMFSVANLFNTQGYKKIEITQAVSTENTAEPFAPRVRCWSEEKDRLVQFSPNVLVLNQLGDYRGWKAFREFIFLSLKTIDELGIVLKINSIRLNTIDFFSVPCEGFALKKWINCEGSVIPKWFENVSTASDLSMGKGFLESDKRNRQISFQTRVKDKEMKIRIHSSFYDVLGEKDSLDTKLEELHQESNNSFEQIITASVREEVMGGQK